MTRISPKENMLMTITARGSKKKLSNAFELIREKKRGREREEKKHSVSRARSWLDLRWKKMRKERGYGTTTPKER